MKRIALIPSYEPDNHLLPLVEELNENGFDIVVVDDGSGPEYKHVFENLPYYCKVLSYEINQGKGYALKHGLNYIKDNNDEEYTIVTLDSDGQHRVSDAIKICEVAEQEKDSLILGSRKFDKSCPRKSRFGNFMARTSFFLFTRKKIYDTQTGLRAWNSSLMERIISAKGNRYEYEMNVLLDCTRHKVPIHEVTIATIYLDDNKGTHYNAFKDTMRIFKEVIKFSISSGIGFLVDLGVFSLLKLIPCGWEFWLIARNVIARVVSASVNFTINYKLVFKSKTNVWFAALKYAGLAIFILVVNSGLLWLLVNVAGLYDILAKVIVEVTMFIISFLVQRLFIFRKRKVNVE